ncbi:2',3'-cyclic-nucleotide 2'-phosphodiesterase (5'-nucleotidase family) [Lysinibacillus composti]|uniref:Bifunctional metallophosphatase/5'-nucleotidase n=1 Tax=Lysinibacillus composti TaxID=720633 RepID=A0A3N9UCM0_9BACI|nr:bifunctional UDP-sugar hydrolase/5'-nucleotidase [Lysinibacillus composti]MBM7609245.1 2',3'-cyclic-nucleotide 2'-phosphodiesterase (5'-nucleotidase family) [Lysinibacillus composti]RQW74104.1 bifunctional metallophosphatase/5'-nucleotidase [Lysinibacillus composti]
MLETIHIYHTNDIHSHFEYWPRMQSFIKKQRIENAKKGEPSFLFDVGDHLDRSNIYTEATLGKGNVKLLNEAQYDVVTIGNNEGITLSFEDLYSLYHEANFDVVVANIEPLHGRAPKWLKPYTILKTESGTTIGVIGATALYKVFYTELNWNVTEPKEKLIEIANQLRSEVDILLCLSHLGITEDELLAEACPAIDVIFGSHTHHLLQDGKMVNGVLLTGCGKFGAYTGHLTLQFNPQTHQLVNKEEQVIENALLSEIEEEEKFLQELSGVGKELLQAPVFETKKTYNKEWFHHSQISKLFAQALLDFTNADCTMFNAGIFLDGLHKGVITSYDIHRILPHPINVCVIELTGTELREILSQSKNEEWPLLELKGLGFRGSIFGKMLTYNFSLNKHRELFVKGVKADLDATYQLATLDMFTFGYFFPTFKYAKKKYYLPLFLRDILVEHGKKYL